MNQQVLEEVLRSPRLPSLPAIALEVIDLVQQEDVSVKRIAQTISHDPALAAKLLKTVNSSFYGQKHAISTISHALVILGMNTVRTLALGFSLVHNLKETGAGKFDHMAFWKRSLISAVAARSLANEAGSLRQEEIFIGGLLQDLGMLAMIQTLGEPYSMLVQQIGDDHHTLVRLEQEQFGIDHTQVGAALAERWRLPSILIAPIRHHEHLNDTPLEIQEVVRHVVLGDRVAEVFMSPRPALAVQNYYQTAESWLDIPRERSEPLLSEIHKQTVEMRRLFDLPTGHLGNAQEILAQANEALLQISLQQERIAQELETLNRRLTQEAATDPLTGMANRRMFGEFICEQFSKVNPQEEPLSLIFMDVDHFKKINDTYGHPVGDQALIALAAKVKESVGRQGLVARYGGEEFALVLPATNKAQATTLADEIRHEVSCIRIPLDNGQELRCTISLGVAVHDATAFTKVEQLIDAADQGVYAAKHAGRNCVRVVTPPSGSTVGGGIKPASVGGAGLPGQSNHPQTTSASTTKPNPIPMAPTRPSSPLTPSSKPASVVSAGSSKPGMPKTVISNAGIPKRGASGLN